jgi:hypothetical protein
MNSLRRSHDWKRRVALFVFAWIAQASLGEDLRFLGIPSKADEGSEIRFQSVGLGDSSTRKVLSWSWDFNGDGVVDATGSRFTNGTQVSATWFATVDPARLQTGNNEERFQVITPVFTVVYTNVGLETFTTEVQSGMTEYQFGPPDSITRDLIVTARGTGNADIDLRVTVSPRLVALGTQTTNRFTAEVTPRIVEIYGTPIVSWRFGDKEFADPKDFDITDALSASHEYTTTNRFTVLTRVQYKVRLASGELEPRTLYRTNVDLVTVVSQPKALTLSRGYRRGFPSLYDWDDITKAYTAEGRGGDRYSYFHHAMEAYQTAQTSMDRQVLTEAANEMIQGQALVGNKRLVEALRIKYPRVVDPGEAVPDRLPEPPGVRQETAAIDVALLDFEAGITMGFEALRQYGAGIFRSRAERGAEPYPQFPGYVELKDTTLSQQPVPIKNEYWQLTGAMEKHALGSVAKAQKLFRLSVRDKSARAEAKEECKKAGLRGYLGMAVLAAGQSPEDFTANKGNDLLAHVKNARDLFEQINAGLNPLGNDGSFIPNESFSSIYEDAREAVADAREAEIRAREEDRTFDRNQADLRNELQSQRGQFITPLVNLTGIDPADYNDLKTYEDQLDYRNTVKRKLERVRAGESPMGFGELGLAAVGEKDALLSVESASQRIRATAERIEDQKWANAQIGSISEDTQRNLTPLIIARAAIGAAIQGTNVADSAQKALKGLVAGSIDAAIEFQKYLQGVGIRNIQNELQLRGLLLDLAAALIEKRRAETAYQSSQLQTERLLSQMDRLIEDLANARDTASNLYFQDPSFRVIASRAQRRAEGELDFAIDRLYRLARTLEYEWTEAFKNPVVIPVNCDEPPSLENPLFDKFSDLESLFVVRTADESKDYLDALRAWDAKLRRINITSVRGPNHAGPVTSEPISIRENILGLTPGVELSQERSIEQFRNFLESRLVGNRLNAANPSIEFDFATGIANNALFPSDGSRWNMRIHSITVDLVAESGVSRRQVAEVDLAMSGMTTLRRFFADPPLADDLFDLTFNLGRADRSAFGVVVPAKINGATGGRPATEFLVMGLKGRPIAATRWVLGIDTSNPSNRDFDYRKLKDIVIRFTYTYGNPPEFPGF